VRLYFGPKSGVILTMVVALGGGLPALGRTSASRPKPHAAPSAKKIPPKAPGPSAKSSPAVPSAIPPTQKTLLARTPVERLRSVKSGPGILIAEPVAKQADAAVADFGAGCARWLHMVVGGHGELGATPLWESVDRARRELGRADARFTLDDATQLTHMIGVSHVALGTISGSESHATLTYQLYWIPDRFPMGRPRLPVGKPITLTDSEDQIVAGLPGMARKLATLLLDTPIPAELMKKKPLPDGAKNLLQPGKRLPRIPASVGLSARELQTLGRSPMRPVPGLSQESGQLLSNLAPKSPLAGLMLLCAGLFNDVPRLTPVIGSLLQQAPDNVLIVGEIGYKMGIPASLPDLRAALDRNLHNYPDNYQLALCDRWRHLADKNVNRERAAAEQMVRCAISNPEAWLLLGMTISREGDSIRHSRFYSALKPEEGEFLNRLYPQWLTAAYTAARLDRQFGKAWLQVATAACFANKYDLADAAFWKAVKLDKENRNEVWWWGMEMYQPKWLDDDRKLQKVARLAAEEYHYDRRALFIVQVLKGIKKPYLAADYASKIVSALRTAAQLHPGDASAHVGYAQALEENDQVEEAMAEYRAAVKLDPQNADAHHYLARLLNQIHKTDDAIQEYQEAKRLAPDALSISEELSEVYFNQRRWEDAITELKNALRLGGTKMQTLFRLGDAYNNKKDYLSSKDVWEQVIRLEPQNAAAHLQLGDALASLNRLTEARNELQIAVRLDPDGENGRMAQDLLNTLPKP
jgi:tetratricopeptide (TPR) repeat protein